MVKSANLYARIESQIVLHNGRPFAIKLPTTIPVDVSTFADAQLDEELEKGYTDIEAGNTRDARSVFDGIRRDCGV